MPPPLLTDLECRLPGVSLDRDSRPFSVVIVFLTLASDILKVENAVRQSEKTSGSLLNPHKSKALAFGRWSVLDNP